ncbi:MAG: hypothetical protein R2751_17765 [Bacteroidales bacterium]
MDDFYKMYGSEEAALLLDHLAHKTIVFGHQSVGNTILDGMTAWLEETGTNIEIVESRELDERTEPAFVHFYVGQNADAYSKVDDFVSVVEKIDTSRVRTVLFKFCYVDFGATTDIEALFTHYEERMEYIASEFPKCRLVLCTVPLTTNQVGIKAVAKRFLNKRPFGEIENQKRDDFNTLIKNRFTDDLPIFDLARLESTYPDGTLNTYQLDGRLYPCLIEDYTYDHGHLNDYGAKMISYNLLAFLQRME